MRTFAIAFAFSMLTTSALGSYVNFESGHVDPIAMTPDASRLLVVNTPDAALEIFAIQPDGGLLFERAVPVGLEPVTVKARTDGEAWVVNHLSDTVSIVDVAQGVVTKTIPVGDEPTDVEFAGGKAFVAISQADAVEIYSLADLTLAPTVVSIFSRDVRALDVSPGGDRVYAVTLRSGNRTTAVNSNIIFGPNDSNMDSLRLGVLGLTDLDCNGLPPSYPDLPAGIARNPALTDPPANVDPQVSLIVSWDEGSGRWSDEDGSNWNNCLPYRLPDYDLFVIDVASSSLVERVSGLGTSLFEVSVHPSGRIYVPNTEARNAVRFEHPLGVQGHVVDNRLSIVDPGNGNALTIVDLNSHIDRASDPATNFAERNASISQPGMLVWKGDGSSGYLTGIGTRKLFRVDGSCLSGSCIFGSTRATPDAVEVGEGPSGVALDEGRDRLYVLNRIDHSIATVEASTLTLLDTRALHDPSSEDTRLGRRFLYDAIDLSGHGDAACSSCHLSGDMDGLAWDLGDPTGEMVPYDTAMDNVRFVVPQGGVPIECDPDFCAAHDGFDPQKGPMTTQTLRGMLEPLHWRGDRPTFNDFNGAFVSLLGGASEIAAPEMERFRQFALGIQYPPNPYRNVDDTSPCGPRSTDPGCEVQPHGSLFAGNPTEGELLYNNHPSDGGQTCASCHSLPHGAGGGVLGGVTPTEPTSSSAAALFNGDADQNEHNDMKIAHLRNMYEKFGPVWAGPGGQPPDTAVGFGFTHDGTVPDLFRFFSINVFTLSSANQAQQVRDIVSFMFHFPTGIRPAVGRQLTVPAGTPPTGTGAEESLLTTLVALGDANDSARHCDLVAATIADGRQRRYRLDGGNWATDAALDAPISITALRENASAPITFTCVTLGSSLRLGGDLDEDQVLDGDDCAPADAGSIAAPQLVAGVTVDATISWDDQASAVGSSVRYDVLSGTLSGGLASSSCLASGIDGTSYLDARPDPLPGQGNYYLLRAVNGCGVGSAGAGRDGQLPGECD